MALEMESLLLFPCFFLSS